MSPGTIRRRTLHDMGGGLLYDELLDLTWLQDAAWVRTSGYKFNGKLSWRDANAWAAQLVYHDAVRGRDIRGWRLPQVRPADGRAFSGRFCLDGSGDEGYNVCGRASELGHMFHVNLGLKGYYSSTGADQSAVCGPAGNGRQGFVVDAGPVRNLMSYIYWTGTPAEPYVDRNAWMFDTQFGFQNFYNQNDMLCPWAVHDGNVAGVAPPAAAEEPWPPPVRIAAPPETRHELDTFTEIMQGRRCEFPFNGAIPADDYWRMWEGMEVLVASSDLAAFWTFGERSGDPRRSIIAGQPFPLLAAGAAVERVEGGPFSCFSAVLDQGRSLHLAAEQVRGLAVDPGEAALYAVARLDRPAAAGTLLAGLGDGTGRGLVLTCGPETPVGRWFTLAVSAGAAGRHHLLDGRPAAAPLAPSALPGFSVGGAISGRIGALALFRRGLAAAALADLHRAANLHLLAEDHP